LPNPVFAFYPTRKTYVSLNPARFVVVPRRNLVIVKHAQSVQQSLNGAADPINSREIVGFSKACRF